MYRQPCDEGVIRSRAAVNQCSRQAGPWILAATILGSSMVFIDGTVVNVALPALQSQLNANVVDVQWVVESYALLLAALLLVGGSFGDRFGRKFIFAIGIVVFALASVWCGLAANITQLIVARAVQGVGGALLVPGSLAIISASFSGDRRGQAIGTWSGFTSITAAIGPVIGGWLIEHVSWRAAFLINPPVAVLVLILLFWHVPESRDEERRSIDWWGAILATLGLGLVVYGLIESSRLGFRSSLVIAALIAGGVGLISFLLRESRTRDAMMPLSLFRSKNFSGANLLTLFLYTALSGALFFVPLNLIQVQGYSATVAGAALLPFIVIMSVLSRWSGAFANRYGARLPLVVGPAIVGIGFLLFTVPGVGARYWRGFFPAVAVLGLGMAGSVAPLTTCVMSSVNRQHAGIASGINNAVSRTAGVLALAIFPIVMLHVFNLRLDAQLENLSLAQGVRASLDEQRIKLAAIEPPVALDEAGRNAVRVAVFESFVSGFRLIMLIASGLAFASSLSAWFTISAKAARAQA